MEYGSLQVDGSVGARRVGPGGGGLRLCARAGRQAGWARGGWGAGSGGGWGWRGGYGHAGYGSDARGWGDHGWGARGWGDHGWGAPGYGWRAGFGWGGYGWVGPRWGGPRPWGPPVIGPGRVEPSPGYAPPARRRVCAARRCTGPSGDDACRQPLVSRPAARILLSAGRLMRRGAGATSRVVVPGRRSAAR